MQSIKLDFVTRLQDRTRCPAPKQGIAKDSSRELAVCRNHGESYTFAASPGRGRSDRRRSTRAHGGTGFMCGIVGYVGFRDAEPILLEGLRRLEYRGYDSAGLATVTGRRLHLRKRAGRVADLVGYLRDQPA